MLAFKNRVWIDNYGTRVIVPVSCLKKMFRYAKSYFPNECGSWLSGNYPNQSECRITGVSKVPKDSDHDATTFRRGVVGFEEVGQAYVGEWHSHPCGVAIPSDVDNSTMEDNRDCKLSGCASPLMMIVSIDTRGKYEANIFMYRRDGVLVKLKEIGGLK